MYDRSSVRDSLRAQKTELNIDAVIRDKAEALQEEAQARGISVVQYHRSRALMNVQRLVALGNIVSAIDELHHAPIQRADVLEAADKEIQRLLDCNSKYVKYPCVVGNGVIREKDTNSFHRVGMVINFKVTWVKPLPMEGACAKAGSTEMDMHGLCALLFKGREHYFNDKYPLPSVLVMMVSDRHFRQWVSAKPGEIIMYLRRFYE